MTMKFFEDHGELLTLADVKREFEEDKATNNAYEDDTFEAYLEDRLLEEDFYEVDLSEEEIENLLTETQIKDIAEWTDEQLDKTQESFANDYYDSISDEPSGIITLDKAQPIIEAWIDQAVDRIESQTGHRMNHNTILADLSDEDWKFYEVTDDGEEAISIDTVSILLDSITEYYIRVYKVEESYYHFTEDETGAELWVCLRAQDDDLDLYAIGKNDNGYYTWEAWGSPHFDIFNREETIRYIDLMSNSGCSVGMFDTFEEADNDLRKENKDTVSLLKFYKQEEE